MGSNATKSDDLDSPSADQDHHSLWSDSGCNSSVISEMEPSPSELIFEPQDFKVCSLTILINEFYFRVCSLFTEREGG